MLQTRGKVPHFSMRPHPVVSALLIIILLVGLLLALSFFSQEDGTGVNAQRATVTLMITGVLSLFLTILATAKFWFPHLWKKNSNHARHKQHTKHHPAMKDKPHHQHRRRR